MNLADIINKKGVGERQLKLTTHSEVNGAYVSGNRAHSKHRSAGYYFYVCRLFQKLSECVGAGDRAGENFSSAHV